ncbi:hypothetical protein BGZ59_007587 [Podila verticillata]|nr:hypothetical protein BGZ59_007587 [Podila verticillata]
MATLIITGVSENWYKLFQMPRSLLRSTVKAPMSLRPDPLRPFPNSFCGPKSVIIPKVYSKDKGSRRPWDAKYKCDSTWMPSNGTYWGSDTIVSGIHFLMDEVNLKPDVTLGPRTPKISKSSSLPATTVSY